MQSSFKNKLFMVVKYGRKNMMSGDKRYVYFNELLTEMYWRKSYDGKVPSKIFKTSEFIAI